MTKKKNVWVIAAAVLVVSGAYFLLPSHKKSVVFDSHITLGINDKNPYGCNAAYRMLPEFFPGVPVAVGRRAPAEWDKISLDSTGQLVVIVAKYFNPTETELNYLLVLAQRGNYVLISALEMNYEARRLFRLQQMYLDAAKGDVVLEGQPMIRLSNTFGARIQRPGQPFSPAFRYPGVDYSNILTTIDTSFLQPLGYNGHHELNLAGVASGSGALLIHTAPVTFTNFFALYHDNYRYLQQLLSLTPQKPRRIIWDEYFLRGQAIVANTGMLSAILQHGNFRWAWGLIAVVLGLFLFTGVKRRQRLIPWHPKPVNESLEFASVIGKLYYEKGDHNDMAQKMTQFFLEQVRQKYQLNTQHIQLSFAQQLAAKSGITPEHAQSITEHIIKTKAGKTDAAQLTALYGLLHDFYKTT